MQQYLNLLQHILNNGVKKDDRTGTGTISTFGYQMRFDLSKGFPLLTTKKVYIKAIIHELLWFLKGETNIKYLVRNDVKIWNEWAFQVYLETSEIANRNLSALARSKMAISESAQEHAPRFSAAVLDKNSLEKTLPRYSEPWNNKLAEFVEKMK